MRRILLPLSLLLSGCLDLMRLEDGRMYPEGMMLATPCVAVRSFAPELRSLPARLGPDSFVGYFDYGPGMPLGPVFLVVPIEAESFNSVGELLKAIDPKRRSFWLKAQLVNSDPRSNEPFEALVPGKHRRSSPISLITERPTALARASLHSACGKRYFFGVLSGLSNDTGTTTDWDLLRKHYELFQSNVQWPL